MEQGKKIVDVIGGQEVWDFQSKVEPSWNTDLSISTRDGSIWRNVFLNLHVDLVSVWIEIKHHRLFCKPVLIVYLRSNLIQILINRLFYV